MTSNKEKEAREYDELVAGLGPIPPLDPERIRRIKDAEKKAKEAARKRR